jgi:2-hydroxy-3-keto-5-methylthiopentenyl-1-phosphate phosphatase
MYIGDGIGDYHAAGDSDFAFAIKGSKLAELLKKSKTPHEEITDFLQVVEAIKRLTRK